MSDEQVIQERSRSVVIDRKRVVALMARAGFSTFGELAEAAGVHPNTLVRILQGGGHQSITLENLAYVLMCNPIDLLVITGFPDPSLGEPGRPLVEKENPY